MKTEVFLLLFLTLATSIQAQVADLELTVVRDPVGPVFPGMTGTLTFTVDNRGPDMAGGVFDLVFISSSDHPTLDLLGIDPRVKFVNTQGSPCGLNDQLAVPPPDIPNPIINYQLFFVGLNAGASQTCVIEFIVSENLREDLDMSWVVNGGFASDPNPVDNRVAVSFPLAITAIPTLSHFALAFFALSLLMAAFVLRRRAGEIADQR